MPRYIPVAHPVCSLLMEIRIVSPLSIAFVAAAYITWRVFRIILRHYTSSLRYLRGPKSRSWLLGNLTDIYDNQDWVAQYGDTLKFTGILSVRRIPQELLAAADVLIVQSDALFTIDTKALNHILHNTACYRRPEIARSGISDFMGQGKAYNLGVRFHSRTFNESGLGQQDCY